MGINVMRNTSNRKLTLEISVIDNGRNISVKRIRSLGVFRYLSNVLLNWGSDIGSNII